MNEGFISYLWQFQYFQKKDLVTSAGDALEIFKAGILNRDAGPDFSNARIKIGTMNWIGTVEIHTKSSGWMDHRHHHDPAYENVVLHVVWENDRPILRSDGSQLPTLELRLRVDAGLLSAYRKLVLTSFSVPCQQSIHTVDEVIHKSMVDRAAVERLESKSTAISELLKRNQGDWQETAYVLLARNFGFSINSAPFQQLAESLPLRILLKHFGNTLQTEALLFGQAGFLDIEPGDDYYQALRKEYSFFDRKYGLKTGSLKKAQWKLLRLRPPNFPAVRLAQFAMLMSQHQNLLSKLFQMNPYDSLRNLFRVRQSEYWLTHYHFNRTADRPVPGIGEASIDTLLINSVAPLLLAYGKGTDSQPMINYAIDLLNHVPPEKNSIVAAWENLGIKPTAAFESQGLIELNNRYCKERNCLNCTIGASLLKPSN